MCMLVFLSKRIQLWRKNCWTYWDRKDTVRLTETGERRWYQLRSNWSQPARVTCCRVNPCTIVLFGATVQAIGRSWTKLSEPITTTVGYVLLCWPIQRSTAGECCRRKTLFARIHPSLWIFTLVTPYSERWYIWIKPLRCYINSWPGLLTASTVPRSWNGHH